MPLETDSLTTAAQLPPQTVHVSSPQIDHVAHLLNQDKYEGEEVVLVSG